MQAARPLLEILIDCSDGACGTRVFPGLLVTLFLCVQFTLCGSLGHCQFVQKNFRICFVPSPRKSLHVTFDGRLCSLLFGITPGLVVQPFQVDDCLVFVD